jgi:hypothetical protein
MTQDQEMSAALRRCAARQAALSNEITHLRRDVEELIELFAQAFAGHLTSQAAEVPEAAGVVDLRDQAGRCW